MSSWDIVLGILHVGVVMAVGLFCLWLAQRGVIPVWLAAVLVLADFWFIGGARHERDE
jgi:hypothetical protein